MKLKCVRSAVAWFTEGNVYSVVDDFTRIYEIRDDNGTLSYINKDTLEEIAPPELRGTVFRIYEDCVQTASTQPLSELQQKCNHLNMSISIDPEGFNIFDLDTEKQVLVHSVEEVDEIVGAKESYQESMSKWEWL